MKIYTTLIISIAFLTVSSCKKREVSQETQHKALKEQAANGDTKAQIQLAIFYYKGEGIDQDKQKALELLDLAIAQGNAEAMFKKSKWISNDEKIGRNKEAVLLLEKSAEKGNIEATKLLAEGYESGSSSFSPNLIKSYLYYQQLNDSDSLKRLKVLLLKERESKAQNMVNDLNELLVLYYGEKNRKKLTGAISYVGDGSIKMKGYILSFDVEHVYFCTNLASSDKVIANAPKLQLMSGYAKKAGMKSAMGKSLAPMYLTNVERSVGLLTSLNEKMDEIREFLNRNSFDYSDKLKLSKAHLYVASVVANVEQLNAWSYPHRINPNSRNGRTTQRINPKVQLTQDGLIIISEFAPMHSYNGTRKVGLITESYNVSDLFFERNSYHKDFCYLYSFTKRKKIGLRGGNYADQSYQVGKLNALLNSASSIFSKSSNNSKRDTFSKIALNPTLQEQWIKALIKIIPPSTGGDSISGRSPSDLCYECKHCGHRLAYGKKPFIVKRECPSEHMSRIRGNRMKLGKNEIEFWSSKCSYKLISEKLGY